MAYEYLREIDPVRSNLIKALQTIQEHEGYIADEAIVQAAEYFTLPAVEVEGVVSFYAKFKRTRPGKYKLIFCDGTACHVKKSSTLIELVERKLGINPETKPVTDDFLFSIEQVSCLGACGMAPVMQVNEKLYGLMTQAKLEKLIDNIIASEAGK
jgi:NADH-quinone oxidoreductase subunit E